MALTNVDLITWVKYILGENTLDDILKNCPKNKIIVDNLINTWLKINNTSYKNIMCSVSGGSDSDIIIDLCKRCDISEKIIYIWFDTGLEYQATKEHLKQVWYSNCNKASRKIDSCLL